MIFIGHRGVRGDPDRLAGGGAGQPAGSKIFRRDRSTGLRRQRLVRNLQCDQGRRSWSRCETEVGQWSTNLLSALPQAGVKFLTVASNLIYVVIIPVLAFFFLKDGGAIREHMLELVDAGPRRALLDDVLADIHLLLAHYMRALVLLSLAHLHGLRHLLFDHGRARTASCWRPLACLLEFIPMIGPLTAGVADPGGCRELAGSHVLAVLIFLVAYRMFPDYVLSPHLMGHGVQLHPLLVLFGVFAGAEVAGIAGTFLSVPVLALARILYLRIRKARLTRAIERCTPRPRVLPSRYESAARGWCCWRAPAWAHVVSMSSGDLTIEGARAHYELRMPQYEMAHVADPERALLEHIRFSSGGRDARLTVAKTVRRGRCRAIPTVCTADYEFSAPVERLDVECTFPAITVPNHVHLLRAEMGGKHDQACSTSPSRGPRCASARPPRPRSR